VPEAANAPRCRRDAKRSVNARGLTLYDNSGELIHVEAKNEALTPSPFGCPACRRTDAYSVETFQFRFESGYTALRPVESQGGGGASGRSGHLFSGLFHIVLIEKEAYLTEVVR
jgi:hypothetical protein